MTKTASSSEVETTSKKKESSATLKTAAKRDVKNKPSKPFPNYSIEDSLRIAFALKEYNAGNPWSPSDIANVLNVSPKTTSYFYLTAASRSYGFTIGARDAKVIELTPLGHKFVYASSINEEYACILEAFNNIPLFKDVYSYYKQGMLPEKKYLTNTLEANFNLESQFHDEFINLYTQNLMYLSSHKTTPSEDVRSSEIQSNKLVEKPLYKQNKNKDSKRELFVIMPFSEKTDKYPVGFFAEMYSSLILPAASQAGFLPVTADKAGSDIIQSTIVNQILSAEMILADLSEHNPNVLFELGLAIAFEKKVALIRAKGTPAIFDVDNLLRVYDYDGNLWRSTIERDIPNLVAHLQATDTGNGRSYLELLKQSL